MEPTEIPHQLLSQLNTPREYVKTPLVNLALPAHHIKIAAGSRREEDRAVFVFNFLEAAEAALLTERLPYFT